MNDELIYMALERIKKLEADLQKLKQTVDTMETTISNLQNDT